MSFISKTSTKKIPSSSISPIQHIQSEQKGNQSNLMNTYDDFGLDEGKEFPIEKIVYKEEPIQLIEFQGSKFKLNPEALKIISSIENDIIVVSIVGKARTGKSYLMNLLLDRIGKDSEFKVQSTTSSCTKGIWLWGNYRNSLTGTNSKILFIDSEGTSSTEASTRTYDSRIFSMIVLLSSLFIYNSESHIDEHSISELSLAAHISNAISTNSGIDKEALITELSPKFIWVLRNFTLEKIHPETGQEISSKEYMEMCLRSKTSGKNSKDNNLIRQNILKYFPERECFTLVRPVESEQDLKRLNKIPFDKLKPTFKWEFSQLKEKIYKETVPKKFNGKKLNGPTLAHLIIEFVNSINSGNIPNINNSWDGVIQKDLKDYYDKATYNYKQKLKKLENQIYEQNDLLKSIYRYKLESHLIFDKVYYMNSEVYLDPVYLKQFKETKRDLEKEFLKFEERILNSNLNKTSSLCQERIKNEFKEINKKFMDNYYTSRLFDEFVKDYEAAIVRYSSSDDCKGMNKLKILTEFLSLNEKNFVKSIVKILMSELDSSKNKINVEVKQIEMEIEDLEIKNKNLITTNEIHENRIRNLEKDLTKEDTHSGDNKERLNNLVKQLEIIKQSESQKINYENSKSKTPNELKSMADYNDKNEKDVKRKKESGCKCLIY